jgi:hypothetical protein
VATEAKQPHTVAMTPVTVKMIPKSSNAFMRTSASPRIGTTTSISWVGAASRSVSHLPEPLCQTSTGTTHLGYKVVRQRCVRVIFGPNASNARTLPSDPETGLCASLGPSGHIGPLTFGFEWPSFGKSYSSPARTPWSARHTQSLASLLCTGGSTLSAYLKAQGRSSFMCPEACAASLT